MIRDSILGERTKPAGACAQAVTERLGGRRRVGGSRDGEAGLSAKAAGMCCARNSSSADGSGAQKPHDAEMQQLPWPASSALLSSQPAAFAWAGCVCALPALASAWWVGTCAPRAACACPAPEEDTEKETKTASSKAANRTAHDRAVAFPALLASFDCNLAVLLRPRS